MSSTFCLHVVSPSFIYYGWSKTQKNITLHNVFSPWNNNWSFKDFHSTVFIQEYNTAYLKIPHDESSIYICWMEQLVGSKEYTTDSNNLGDVVLTPDWRSLKLALNGQKQKVGKWRRGKSKDSKKHKWQLYYQLGTDHQTVFM